VKRRTLIKLALGASATGLLLSVAYDKRFTIIQKVSNYIDNKDFDPNAFIFIQSDGAIKIICHRSEMGQGARTAIPMLMVEELDVTWEQVQVVQGLGDAKYGSQNTDGSKSIRDFYLPLRKAAASAREMLVSAAALIWDVPDKECDTLDGFVLHKKTNRQLAYGDLVSKARQIPVPKFPTLKTPSEFKVIGKPKAGVDIAAIVKGEAQFGIDVTIPQMLIASLLRAPVPGAKIKSIFKEDALSTPGVVQVIELEEQGRSVNASASVAVVATNTWAAFSGRAKLKVEWDFLDLKRDHSSKYRNKLEQELNGSQKAHRSEGNINRGKKKSSKVIEASYHTPYLVHAPMEPLVSTAYVKEGSCEVWAPCQDPQRAMKLIAKLLDIKIKDIKFNVTFLGGGFGRKSQPDFVLESVLLSKKLKKPIKIQWSREDEIKHGFYHSESLQKLQAGVDETGYPITWHHKAVFPTILSVFMSGATTPADWESGMGATNMPYRIENILCEVGSISSSVRIGWMRSVCNVWHAFAVNSFVDELALNATTDPIAFRLRLLGSAKVLDPNDNFPQDTGRLIKVIERTRDEFGWENALAIGYGKGFASHYSFKSYVAIAIEVNVAEGEISIKKVVCTIDCGIAVNPDSVRAQMEGAIVFGLSAALYGKITLRKGIVKQGNFDNYPVLRMDEMPKVQVHIINGNINVPTGVGEPGVPPVAPALASAIYFATGKRLRDLPLRLS
jgi:isoquinoline 1-oxidoreductase subunit beta